MAAAMLNPGASSADDKGETAKTVLNTGANRGLGLEFARQYSAAGWNVIGTARTPPEATDLKDLGVRVLRLDVADAESVAGMAAALADEPVDLLINNAGMANRDGMSFESLSFDGVEQVMAVNTIGPMRVTRALLPNLRLGTTNDLFSEVSLTPNETRSGSFDFSCAKTLILHPELWHMPRV